MLVRTASSRAPGQGGLPEPARRALLGPLRQALRGTFSSNRQNRRTKPCTHFESSWPPVSSWRPWPLAQAGAPSDAQIAGIVVAANPVDINEVTHHLTMKATLVVK